MLNTIQETLLLTCHDYLERKLPPARLFPVAALLSWHGGWPGDCTLADKIAAAITDAQLEDGGWCNIEQTAWALLALEKLPGNWDVERKRGKTWLYCQRNGDGWGFSIRHKPCIPATALVLLALHVGDATAERWLAKTWQNDLKSKYQLSYKAAWYLLACAEQADEQLKNATLRYLAEDQRDDGSWGPWKDHPAPTDCPSTGMVMLAMSKYPHNLQSAETERCIFRARNWMDKNITKDGFFPTHYIEYGTAWLYAGLSSWQMQGFVECD